MPDKTLEQLKAELDAALEAYEAEAVLAQVIGLSERILAAADAYYAAKAAYRKALKAQEKTDD